MIQLLFAVVLAFQTPVVENARVKVWQTTPPAGSFEMDTLAITADPSVRLYKAGALAVRAPLLIGLKNTTVAPLPNTSGQPLAMQRPGAKKIYDDARVTVWDYRWTLHLPTPMHFHDKDVVVMFLEEGDLKSTTIQGEATLNQWKPFTVRFNARDRVHTEELVRGTQRAIIVELK
jgi:hypothetical protein